MCKVSNELKLCSCKIEDVESLKHFWKLFRTTEDSTILMGETMPPPDIGKENEEYNIKSLRTALNSGNCFDVPIKHNEHDILHLYFTLEPASAENIPYDQWNLVYAFVFKKGKWHKKEFDPFQDNLITKKSGEISNPFQ
ncbi:MAG: hypothetical protein ABIN36_08225 [Ferruginibacter sp.]